MALPQMPSDYILIKMEHRKVITKLKRKGEDCTAEKETPVLQEGNIILDH